MNPVSEDIKDVLVQLREGTFAGTSETSWNIYINEEPMTPDMSITVYDLSASGTGVANTTVPLVQECPFQIRVRGKRGKDLDTYKKLDKLIKLLRQRGRWTVQGIVQYHGVFLRSGPLFLEKDENSRYIWVATMYAKRQ